MENKKAFRRQQIQKLSNFFQESIAQSETKELYRKLFDSFEFKKAKSIGITISMGFELDTKPIIMKSLKLNKVVYIPKTDMKTKEMNFVKFINYESLEPTEFGVLEPIKYNDILNPPELVIVPGLAYNTRNYRIGFGAGFYDRYLARFKPQTISLANSKQMYNENSWRVEKHDVAIDKIISVK